MIAGTGCGGNQDATFQYIEIAQGKFVVAKFPASKPKDMFVKFRGEIVRFSSPSGVDRAQSLLEHDGVLYVLAPAHSVPGHRERWSMRSFKQVGKSFKEIPAAEYPRRIATINIWRANEERKLMRPRQWAKRYILSSELIPEGKWTRDASGRLHYTGMGEAVMTHQDVSGRHENGRALYADQKILATKLDTEDLDFVFSDIALLWFMLEIENSFASSRYPWGDIAFLREFKAKYNPVVLSGADPGEVPESERDF